MTGESNNTNPDYGPFGPYYDPNGSEIGRDYGKYSLTTQDLVAISIIGTVLFRIYLIEFDSKIYWVRILTKRNKAVCSY